MARKWGREAVRRKIHLDKHPPPAPMLKTSHQSVCHAIAPLLHSAVRHTSGRRHPSLHFSLLDCVLPVLPATASKRWPPSCHRVQRPAFLRSRALPHTHLT